MKISVFAAGFFFLSVSGVVAQEMQMDNDSLEDNTVIISDQNDEFSRPNEVLGEIKAPKAPTCQDPHFLEKIVSVVKNFLHENEYKSTVGRRHERLVLANLQEFETVSAEGFSDKQDVRVADALIMLKINEKVSSDNILICRQKTLNKNPVYVIVYPYIDNYKGLIYNLSDPGQSNKEVDFIYP